MAAIPANQILRLTVILTIAGNRLSFVLNYSASSTLAANQPETFAGAWQGACLAALLDVFSQEVKVNAIKCECVEKEVCNPWTTYLSNQPGTIAVEAVPANLSAIIQLRQLEISSKHNGRINLPGIPEDAVVDSLLTTTYISTILAPLVTALMGPIVAGGDSFVPVVVDKAPAAGPGTTTGRIVHSAIAVRNMGTQRRRTTELREYHP